MAIETSNPAVHTTGPVHHFVQIPGSSVPNAPSTAKTYYLGTCETQPQIKVQRLYKDVFNDIRGRSLPFQQILQGEVAVVGVMLTRFSQVAYNAIRDPGQGISGAATVTPGYESNLGGPGTLVFGNTSLTLWQMFDFYGTTAPGATYVPPGRKWLCATLADHEIVDSGTAEEKLLLVFNCFGLYNSSTRAFQFYSEAAADMTDGTNAINRAAVQ